MKYGKRPQKRQALSRISKAHFIRILTRELIRENGGYMYTWELREALEVEFEILFERSPETAELFEHNPCVNGLYFITDFAVKECDIIYDHVSGMVWLE